MAGAADFERETDPQQQIRQFLGVIRRGWLAILTSLGAGLLLGLGLYFFVPKTYVSSAKLELTSNWMFDSLAQARDMETLPYSLRKRNLEDQLRSTTYVEPVLDECEWDDWSRAKAQGPQERMVFLRKVKEKIDTRVVRGELGETLVFVNFGWHDKDRAREFCEKLTRWWIDSGVRNHIADVSAELSMGEQLLTERKRELDQISRRLEEFQVRHQISDIDQRQGATIQLDGLLQQEALHATQVAGIEAQLDALDRKLLAVGPDGELSLPPTLPASSPLVDSQRAAALVALEQTVKQIEAMRVKGLTDKWRPLTQLIHSLESQLIALSNQSAGQIDDGPKVPNLEWRIVFDQREGIELELEGLRAAGKALAAKIADQRRLLETLPQVLRQHTDLQAEVTVKRQLLTEQELRLAPIRDKKFASDRRGPRAQQPVVELEKPMPATAPSAFLGIIALTVSTLLGVGGALAAVIGRELFRASFRSAEQARHTLKLPVLGEVAPIQTVPELRRARLVRVVQIVASAVLLVGIGAAIWVCVEHPGELPRSLVEWALDLRASLA